MKGRIFLLITLCTISITYSAESSRNGNWWLLQSKEVKQIYMIGFFDGMDLGHDFSYWKFFNDINSSACLNKVSDSYNEHLNKYLTDVTNVQLVDGLDSFYTDFKNRRIKIELGIWLVLNQIAGKSQKEMEKIIESFRKNALQ